MSTDGDADETDLAQHSREAQDGGASTTDDRALERVVGQERPEIARRPAGRDELTSRVTVSEPVEPGDVLVLDPQNPGAMGRAHEAADPGLIGIVVERSRQYGEGTGAATLETSVALA